MKSRINVLWVLLLFLVASCMPEAKLDQPNIVWITSEDNSSCYMKMYDSNGAETPNIEKLAEGGLIYTHAFSNAPVCSAARSTLISGCYGPRLASHYHRNAEETHLPESIRMFPYYLRQAGYFTSNNSKEDYNIAKVDTVWDESSNKASWRNRNEGQAFFYMYNIGTTHESCMHFSQQEMEQNKTVTNADECFVQPNHPQTPLFKYSNAFYRDRIMQMDKQVGEVVEELRKDGLLENTIIFYFGDNGGVLPGSKGYLSEGGVHVPLVISFPEKYKYLLKNSPSKKSNAFVSFVDFGATVLNIAGINIPAGINGKPFLGKGVTEEQLSKKDETYSYADRMDEKYDMVRATQKGKYRYIRNYQPFNFDALMNNYRYKQLAYGEWKSLFDKNELDDLQSQFWVTKPAELLFDMEADPYETNNLAESADHQAVLAEMRDKLFSWEKELPDLSFYPEFFLIRNAIDDPIKFGLEHKQDIQKYMEIANLALADFESVKQRIAECLNSNDPWERYWALIGCSSFANEAREMTKQAKSIAQNDAELINRVRAAEFLGLIGEADPADVMLKALYQSTDPSEALLILNSITLMKDCNKHYQFNIDMSKLNAEVAAFGFNKWRLEYLMQ